MNQTLNQHDSALSQLIGVFSDDDGDDDSDKESVRSTAKNRSDISLSSDLEKVNGVKENANDNSELNDDGFAGCLTMLANIDSEASKSLVLLASPSRSSLHHPSSPSPALPRSGLPPSPYQNLDSPNLNSPKRGGCANARFWSSPALASSSKKRRPPNKVPSQTSGPLLPNESYCEMLDSDGDLLLRQNSSSRSAVVCSDKGIGGFVFDTHVHAQSKSRVVLDLSSQGAREVSVPDSEQKPSSLEKVPDSVPCASFVTPDLASPIGSHSGYDLDMSFNQADVPSPPPGSPPSATALTQPQDSSIVATQPQDSSIVAAKVAKDPAGVKFEESAVSLSNAFGDQDRLHEQPPHHCNRQSPSFSIPQTPGPQANLKSPWRSLLTGTQHSRTPARFQRSSSSPADLTPTALARFRARHKSRGKSARVHTIASKQLYFSSTDTKLRDISVKKRAGRRKPRQVEAKYDSDSSDEGEGLNVPEEDEIDDHGTLGFFLRSVHELVLLASTLYFEQYHH